VCVSREQRGRGRVPVDSERAPDPSGTAVRSSAPDTWSVRPVVAPRFGLWGDRRPRDRSTGWLYR